MSAYWRQFSVALSLVVLICAYAWKSVQMAILNVGFVWLGYFIAYEFYPNSATVRAEKRWPKAFEVLTLHAGYAAAFCIVVGISWLLKTFNFQSSELQAAREQATASAMARE